MWWPWSRQRVKRKFIANKGIYYLYLLVAKSSDGEKSYQPVISYSDVDQVGDTYADEKVALLNGKQALEQAFSSCQRAWSSWQFSA